jgi:hypothetical protein
VAVVVGVGAHRALLGGLGQHPQRQAVRRVHRVQRAAHHRRPDRAAAGEQLDQLGGPEPVQARPEAVVRRIGCLRLHPDQVGEHVGDRAADPAQQQLAGQQRPVQRLRGEHLGAHG